MDVYERANFEHSQSQAWNRQRQGAFISPPGSESHSRHGPETLSVSTFWKNLLVSMSVFRFQRNRFLKTKMLRNVLLFRMRAS